jgi:hypothetical protein
MVPSGGLPFCGSAYHRLDPVESRAPRFPEWQYVSDNVDAAPRLVRFELRESERQASSDLEDARASARRWFLRSALHALHRRS